MQRSILLACYLGTVLFLSSCGSGGGEETVAVSDAPATGGASTAAAATAVAPTSAVPAGDAAPDVVDTTTATTTAVPTTAPAAPALSPTDANPSPINPLDVQLRAAMTAARRGRIDPPCPPILGQGGTG